jgi:hypothetical protein
MDAGHTVPASGSENRAVAVCSAVRTEPYPGVLAIVALRPSLARRAISDVATHAPAEAPLDLGGPSGRDVSRRRRRPRRSNE